MNRNSCLGGLWVVRHGMGCMHPKIAITLEWGLIEKRDMRKFGT